MGLGLNSGTIHLHEKPSDLSLLFTVSKFSIPFIHLSPFEAEAQNQT